MISSKEAIESALCVLDHVDVLQEFKNYFVAIDNHVPEMDSSANMVAVDKETAKRYNFVAVIPRLGKELRTYAVGESGELVEEGMS